MKLNSADASNQIVLNNSELLFKIFSNQKLQFIAILSPDGKVIEVNNFALISQNASRADYVDKFFWKSPAWCNLPEWEAIWKQRLLNASNQQDPIITEDIYQTIDSEIHYADASTVAIYDPNTKKLIGYIVQTIDTTERKKTENQIVTTETRLELILQEGNIGNWELNLIDHTSRRSLAHDKIFGYDSLLPQWTYEIFIEHVIPEERAEVERKYQLAIETESDWNLECRIVRKDGEIRWILASGGHYFDSTGQAKLLVGIAIDITDLKHAEIDKLNHSDELQSLFNALPDTYFRLMPDGTILDCQSNDENEFHIKIGRNIGNKIQDFLPKIIGDLFKSKINEALQFNKTLVFKYQLEANNKQFHFDARINKVSHNNELICVIRDVTEEFESKKSLATNEQLFRTIFCQTAIGVALISDDLTKVLRINQRLCDMLGYSKNELKNPTVFQSITHPKDLESGLAFRAKILSGQQREGTIEKRYIHKKGHIVWVELTISPIWEINKQPQGLIMIVQDISERKKTEEKLQLSARIVSETHEGIMIISATQAIIDVNPAFTQITGYSKEEVIGKSPNTFNSGKQTTEFYTQMWQSIINDGHWQGEIWNRTKQGTLYAELLNISSLTNEHKEVTHYIGVFSDITSIKQQQDELNLMAHYDVLTKLPNRALFVDRFHHSIAHSIRTGHQLAVCFLDLDDFKPVNDNYGHEAGDCLLIEVAKRITSCIREEDTVSRQGGDEFAILLNDIKSASQYEVTMTRIHQALAKPYIINEVEHHITASSGVTLYPSDNGDIDTLLRHADHAMYQSKLSGKHRCKLYNPDSDQRIIQKNLQLIEIEQALARYEFQLYYQPKVNMVTGKVYGAEALIRWIHPEKGLIPPLEFLPLVDGTPLEITIGEWVINEALQQLSNWQQQGINLEVSVNISSNHILSPFFVEVLKKCLEKHSAIKAQYLELEILESSTLGDLTAITNIIKTCQNTLGVMFSLDDFGTGYSSLTHLRSLPAETIKIDQTFVRDVLDDPGDYSIIDGVISLSKSFNRKVIAEGVETTNHGLMLILMGCEQAQGYGIAKPMPASVLNQWLENYIPNKAWLVCDSNYHNTREKSLRMFKLITEQWKARVTKKVLSLPNDAIPWPIIDSQLCHCGNWINLRKQEQLFEKEHIIHIEKSHNKIHAIVYEIQLKYQTGDIKSARVDLAKFDLAFHEMSTVAQLSQT
jgi:diguanylate cyclase (GGDEF)-like protein/PAS domain S-box-containing protein